MKLGDTSLLSSCLPGQGCGSSAGHGVPHAVAGLVSCLTLGADPWLILPLWGLPHWQWAGPVVVSLITMAAALATG